MKCLQSAVKAGYFISLHLTSATASVLVAFVGGDGGVSVFACRDLQVNSLCVFANGQGQIITLLERIEQ